MKKLLLLSSQLKAEFYHYTIILHTPRCQKSRAHLLGPSTLPVAHTLSPLQHSSKIPAIIQLLLGLKGNAKASAPVVHTLPPLQHSSKIPAIIQLLLELKDNPKASAPVVVLSYCVNFVFDLLMFFFQFIEFVCAYCLEFFSQVDNLIQDLLATRGEEYVQLCIFVFLAALLLIPIIQMGLQVKKLQKMIRCSPDVDHSAARVKLYQECGLACIDFISRFALLLVCFADMYYMKRQGVERELDEQIIAHMVLYGASMVRITALLKEWWLRRPIRKIPF